MLAGTWSWRDLDEALAPGGGAILVRLTVSGGDPVLVFPGQSPARGVWSARRKRLGVTATRILPGSMRAVRVTYRLRATTSGGRVRLAGRLLIRDGAHPGASAVTAQLVARPA